MNFKQFLIEKHDDSRHMLTYQKLIHALDAAHITSGEGNFEFNLGTVVKDSSLGDLHVRIQKGSSDDVKLGRHKDGRMMLVIFCQKLPDRMGIDSLLSNSKPIMKKFVANVAKFYNQYRSPADDAKQTAHERREKMDNPEAFEENYDKLTKAIDAKMKEYNTAVEELEKTHGSTVSVMKKAAVESAKSKLKDEYFGKSEKEFVKKMYKLPEADFVSYLEKEVLNKLNQRLSNYYEQKF